MSTHFIFKLFVYAFLIGIIIALGTGLYYLVKPNKRHKERLAQALTTRIGLSIALLLTLVLAIAMGWLKPHSLLTMPRVPLELNKQKQTDRATQSPQSANTKQPLQNQSGDSVGNGP